MKKFAAGTLDSQGSLSRYFLSARPSSHKKTVHDVLIRSERVEPIKVRDHLSIVPANIDLAATDVEVSRIRNQEGIFKRALENLYGKDNYSYWLFDCPTAPGTLPDNALCAADYVIIPVACDSMSEDVMELIETTVDEIVRMGLNPTLKKWRILPTRYVTGTLHSKEILQLLTEQYGKLVYPEPMKEVIAYKDARAARTEVGLLNKGQNEYWERLVQTLIAETKGVS